MDWGNIVLEIVESWNVAGSAIDEGPDSPSASYHAPMSGWEIATFVLAGILLVILVVGFLFC